MWLFLSFLHFIVLHWHSSFGIVADPHSLWISQCIRPFSIPSQNPHWPNSHLDFSILFLKVGTDGHWTLGFIRTFSLSPSPSPYLHLLLSVRLSPSLYGSWIGFITVTDSAVCQSVARHLHVMNIHEWQPKSCRSSPPTSSTKLEQRETVAPEQFFHQNWPTGQSLLLVITSKLLKKLCNNTFNNLCLIILPSMGKNWFIWNAPLREFVLKGVGLGYILALLLRKEHCIAFGLKWS